MARRKTAQADDTATATDDTPKAPAAPKRVTLRNTKATNGAIGAIAKPLAKDAAAWLAAGWVRY